MLPVDDAFEFDYFGSDLVYGRNCVDRLDGLLASHDLDAAMVVCGSNVGANDAVMEPLERGLGDRLAGVFDGTTPAKSADAVFDGIEVVRETDADVLVGVGGGSSLDIARQMSALAADGRSLTELRTAAREGAVEPPDPDDPRIPVVVVPTTFAGAGISSGGSIEVLPAAESPTDQPVTVGGSAMPTAMFYDPNLFETTPTSVLSGSAMNGFDKGLETIYSRGRTAISDATAVHGLRLLCEGLPAFADDPRAMERAVIGLLLVQFERRISIVHAFGHGFARRYPVQQGTIHAIVVPHVLRYLFSKVDGRRALLAEGLGVDQGGHTDAELAEEIVDAVVAVRDSLDVPTRLRQIDVVEEGNLRQVAEFILDAWPMAQAPPDLEASVDELEGVLHDAW